MLVVIYASVSPSPGGVNSLENMNERSECSSLERQSCLKEQVTAQVY